MKTYLLSKSAMQHSWLGSSHVFQFSPTYRTSSLDRLTLRRWCGRILWNWLHHHHSRSSCIVQHKPASENKPTSANLVIALFLVILNMICADNIVMLSLINIWFRQFEKGVHTDGIGADSWLKDETAPLLSALVTFVSIQHIGKWILTFVVGPFNQRTTQDNISTLIACVPKVTFSALGKAMAIITNTYFVLSLRIRKTLEPFHAFLFVQPLQSSIRH